jgi:hypothetical protein
LKSEYFAGLVDRVANFCTDPSKSCIELEFPEAECALHRKVAHRVCSLHGLKSVTHGSTSHNPIIAVRKPDAWSFSKIPPLFSKILPE